MTNSMTGFASGKGETEGWRWSWDIRSVNARGLDLRFRMPDWLEGLEPAIRDLLRARLARGSVTVSLKLHRDEVASARLALDPDLLNAALQALHRIENEAREAHRLTLAPSSAADLLGAASAPVRDEGLSREQTRDLVATLLADLAPVIDEFRKSRAEEGAALNAIIAEQVDTIEGHANAARDRLPERAANAAVTLKENLARVMENAEGADADRVAQELAILAVKSDVAEELDRLDAHIAAARELLAATDAIGRKFDFLTQEFNREANTLCSKAQDLELTRIGLDLKAVIDQMREQVQNVE